MSKKAKRKKYLDLAREPRKLWNMMVIVISIVIGTFERGMEELELGERIKTIQITPL